ncbi:hypothetical protein GNX18_13185 [Microbulbifer sp. SH-1]|uniref:hypothetical protein n=1 Tax=Microbulbifer sp. SH-1 TaxID=2681547 RepID=UPI00140A0092|nr:hypothetical protein [Microbulbifer sp. SH-1]QIL90606.1 hypothetical protein GNX18_13185 [Microbulbifer sp. SH-1]
MKFFFFRKLKKINDLPTLAHYLGSGEGANYTESRGGAQGFFQKNFSRASLPQKASTESPNFHQFIEINFQLAQQTTRDRQVTGRYPQTKR